MSTTIDALNSTIPEFVRVAAVRTAKAGSNFLLLVGHKEPGTQVDLQKVCDEVQDLIGKYYDTDKDLIKELDEVQTWITTQIEFIKYVSQFEAVVKEGRGQFQLPFAQIIRMTLKAYDEY